MADDVQLTDLEIIQRYSLAVRVAAATRVELIAVLQADLDWLRGGRRPPVKSAPAKPAAAKPAAAKPTRVKRLPSKRTA